MSNGHASAGALALVLKCAITVI